MRLRAQRPESAGALRPSDALRDAQVEATRRWCWPEKGRREHCRRLQALELQRWRRYPSAKHEIPFRKTRAAASEAGREAAAVTQDASSFRSEPRPTARRRLPIARTNPREETRYPRHCPALRVRARPGKAGARYVDAESMRRDRVQCAPVRLLVGWALPTSPTCSSGRNAWTDSDSRGNSILRKRCAP